MVPLISRPIILPKMACTAAHGVLAYGKWPTAIERGLQIRLDRHVHQAYLRTTGPGALDHGQQCLLLSQLK